MNKSGTVVAVSRSATHSFSKQNESCIFVVTGEGVRGDSHAGATVRHRSRVARDPTQPNLRQIHLIHRELFTELHAKGLEVAPGQMGENVTTESIDLLALPTGAHLCLGETAVVEITGLRNPCSQLDDFLPGLTAAVLDRNAEGALVRKAGVMGIVLRDGAIRPGDPIRIVLPSEPFSPLACV